MSSINRKLAKTVTPVVRGTAGLTVTAVRQVAQIVEGMHANISPLVPMALAQRDAKTWGITALVYNSIQAITAATGWSLEQLFKLVDDSPSGLPSDATALGLLSATNGVVGDYLAASDNPLAIQMQLRQQGRALFNTNGQLSEGLDTGGKLLIGIHGLCMNDQQWNQAGRNYIQQLADEIGYTPLTLVYNSGRHISENGSELAERLEELLEKWSQPIEEVVIVAHSMGGLITRSALAQASDTATWPSLLSKVVCLGTPHHGAALERGGLAFQRGVEVLPYVAPLARLGMLRSAGITDLRHSNLLPQDWQGGDKFEFADDQRTPCPIPEGIEVYCVAGSLKTECIDGGENLIGDGLVSVASAFGDHPDVQRALSIPEERRYYSAGLNHMQLLADDGIYQQIKKWLAQ